MESLDGVLSRIVFHKPSKWSRTGSKYLIGRLHSGVTVKGEMDDPREGENYRFYGEMRDQKGYDDPAFEFETFEVVIDQTTSGVVQYLKSYVSGLGIVKAQAIVDSFGDETFHVLRTDPERTLNVHGITSKIMDSIREHFKELERRKRFDPVAYAKLIDLFAGHRVPKNVIKDLVNLYSSDAPKKVIGNPYLLLSFPRMGWKTVDSFALSVVKFDPEGLERHAAAIMESFLRLAGDGHTHAPKLTVDSEAFNLLGSVPKGSAWTLLISDGDVMCWPEDPATKSPATFAMTKYASAEKEVAERLLILTKSALFVRCPIGIDGLKPAQVDAVRLIEEHGVCLLCGAPGTGKSHTIARFIDELVKGGVAPDLIRVVTPTGKAAKRASELLNNYLPPDTIASTTIHKALAPKPSADDGGIPVEMARRGRAREPFSFTKNAQDPLKVNILIVDETSMVDVRLMASLLRAVPKGTRIVFVGDHNQLPSVGPGAVLRDMLASGIPTAMLTEIVRSDGGGRVVRACHAIKDGIVPEPAATVGLPTENWVHVEREDMREIAEIIVGLHESASRNYVAGGPEDGGKGFDPVWGMQVVSPQNGKLPIACAYLNRLLAAKLNPLAAQQEGLGEAGLSLGSQAQTSGDGPPGNKEDDYEVSGPPFFVGDKVVRTKNGLCDEMLLMPPGNFSFDRPEFTWRGNSYSLAETAIVNGDMGTVLDIIEGRKGMQVIVFFRNPGRLCRLPYGGCELIQAYAMTCHKAQGSGFPYVIVPVHEQFYWDQKKGNGLFSREWVYTAVSRAEKLLVTVGQFSAIRKAVGRKTVHLRQTKLANLIRNKFPQLVPTEA